MWKLLLVVFVIKDIQLGITCPDNCFCTFHWNWCNTCKNGYYGSYCRYLCPENCKDNTCGRYDSYCTCEDGYYSLKYNNYYYSCNLCDNKCNTCKQRGACTSCRDGVYGQLCDLPCSSTCSHCHQLTGVCTECSNNTFGQFCELDCSSTCSQLMGVDSSCWQGNGTCKHGCIQGFTGANCNESIAGASSSESRSGSVAVTVGASCGAVILIVVLVISGVILWRRRGICGATKKESPATIHNPKRRRTNEVTNPAYGDTDAGDDLYAVIEDKPNSGRTGMVNEQMLETNNDYDVAASNANAQEKVSSRGGDNSDMYSHINHASVSKQRRQGDNEDYYHVTNYIIPGSDADNTYDVTSGRNSRDDDYSVHETSEPHANEYSTVRHVQ